MENNTNAPQVPPEAGKSAMSWGTGKIVVSIIGFILVLFVAVALGIYFGVIAPRLDAAKERGIIASIKADMGILRSQGELYADANDGSYAGVCRSQMFISMFTSIIPNTYDEDLVCYDNPTAYVVAATYQDVDGIKTFCVNSAGAANTLTGRASELVVSTGFDCGVR